MTARKIPPECADLEHLACGELSTNPGCETCRAELRRRLGRAIADRTRRELDDQERQILLAMSERKRQRAKARTQRTRRVRATVAQGTSHDQEAH